jgi:hypothetical protein
MLSHRSTELNVLGLEAHVPCTANMPHHGQKDEGGVRRSLENTLPVQWLTIGENAKLVISEHIVGYHGQSVKISDTLQGKVEIQKRVYCSPR